MRKLDLDTLTDERLRGAVSAETYQHGEELFHRGAVHIDNAGELAADFTVVDKRPNTVQMRITREAVTFKCTCSHASRGLICEHDVAAWLALRRRLLQAQPAPWQTQLGRVIDAAESAPRRLRPSEYLLFFSLQSEYRTFSGNYRLIPVTLAHSSLPAELRGPQTPGLEAILAALEAKPALRHSLRVPASTLEVEGCRNAGPEVVALANILTERIHSRGFGEPVGLLHGHHLELAARFGSPVFLGTPSDPLQRRLVVHLPPAVLQLELSRVDDGLRLAPALVVFDNPPPAPAAAASGAARIDIDAQRIEMVLGDPLWLLSESHLFRLPEAAGLELLEFFGEQSEVLVPASQVAVFNTQYLAELARRYPLAGEALAWSEVDAPPLPRLYLSDQDGELQAQLRFAYEGLEVRFDPDYPESSIQRPAAGLAAGPAETEPALVRIRRRPQAEKAAADELASAAYGLKRAALPARPGLFRLRARTHPVDFLLNAVPRLARAGFEVYGEEQLKTARVNRSTPTISFKVSSGIDWFDLRAVVNFGDLEVSLADLRRAMRKRERFLKLADGSIGEIPAEWIERYRHLFALGEAEGETLRLASHHVALLEASVTAGDRLEADAEFERRRSRLRLLAEKKFARPGAGQGSNGAWITPHPTPAGFSGELRPYQQAGFDWLHFLREIRFGGCLADDMGLGKTIQALAFLQSVYAAPQRPAAASLLVAPRSLLVNWQREAARFTPELRFLEYFDTGRPKQAEAFNQAHVVITTYGVLLRDIRMLHGYTFHYAVLDESQAIKNPLSQTARAAHLLRADHKLALTGTPIENSTAELWSQFAFLNPGLLGSLQYFKDEFGLPIEKKGDPQAAEALRKLVFPFILRRTKDQVAPELPPRSEKILYCDMEPAQRKLYNKTRDLYRGAVLGILDTEGLNAGRIKILEGLLRLRQICNHPRLVDPGFHGASAKFDLLLETLETLQAEDHKALVFSQFVKMLSLLRKELDERAVPYTYLDGRTVARQEQVDRFQAEAGIPFFLISLRAGGLGLNLTAADYVIHIDPWWNPAVEMQASDRTHRIGQDKPVFVFKLIARDSVEEKILVLQERKRSLVEQIITSEKAFFKNLTREDVEELFG